MQNRRIEKRGLTIGQMAERTGLATSAIRFYEEQGLVRPFRTDNGQRRFDRADLRRLSFIMISQGLGFSIAQIRKSLSKLPENRTPNKADWTRLSKGFQRELDSRIKQMQVLRDRLDGCIGCGCLSLKKCTLYNPRDRAQQKGAGPRYVMGDNPD